MVYRGILIYKVPVSGMWTAKGYWYEADSPEIIKAEIDRLINTGHWKASINQSIVSKHYDG